MEVENALRPDGDVVSRKVGDRLVVVNLRTNRIYELNRTAARLWEFLETGRERAELEQVMLQEFDVHQPELSKDIDQTLALLSSEGLITEYDRA